MSYWRGLLYLTATLIALPVTAQAQCVELDKIAHVIERVDEFAILSGDKLERALLFFAAYTGTESTFTSAYIGIGPAGNAFLLVGEEGTVCGGLMIQKDSVRGFLEIIYGGIAA